MVASFFKKFGKENNLKNDKGVVYGVLNDYYVTFKDHGMYYEMMSVATHLTDDALSKLKELSKDIELRKKYRFSDIMGDNNHIDVVLLITSFGYEKVFPSFIKWFFDKLNELGATKANICPFCDTEVDETNPCMLISGVAYHLHNFCFQMNYNTIENYSSSYLKGFIGSTIGALIGAVIHAVSLNFGFISTGTGALIGLLSFIFYNIFNGKKGRLKYVLITVSVVIGIFAGVLGATIIELIIMIMKDGGRMGYKLSDIPMFMSYLFTQRDYIINFYYQLAMSFLFALAGYALFLISNKDFYGIKKLK